MAKVPTYSVDQAEISTESSKAPINPAKAAGFGEAVETVGEGLAGLGEHFKKLRDAQEITAGKVALSKAADAIHINSLKDPDVWNQPEKIDQAYQEAIEAAGQHITSGEARMKFDEEAQLITDRKRSTLMMQVMNRQSNLYKGTYVDRIDQLSKEYEVALPQDQAVIRAEMEREKANAISVGGVSPAYADAHLRQVMSGLGANTLKSDLGSADASPDPVKLIQNIQAELKKGDEGKYKDIPADKRDAAFKEAQLSLDRAQKTAPERVKVVKHLYDKRLTDKYADNSLTEQDLIHAQNRMTDTVFGVLSKNLLSGNMTTVSNPQEYSKLISVISNENISEKDAVTEIIKSENDGKLTSDESKSLVKMFQVSPDDDPIFKLPNRPDLNNMYQAQEESRKASQQKKGILNTIYNFFSDRYGKNSSKTVESTKQVIKNINQESDTKTKNSPQFVMSESQKIEAKNRLERFPAIAGFPKEGKVVNGWRIYPDGTASEESDGKR